MTQTLRVLALPVALASFACSTPDPGTDSGEGTTADGTDGTDPYAGPIGLQGDTLVGPHGGTLVRLTAGSFEMGCVVDATDCSGDELTVMPVTLTHDFYVGLTEVTQGQYEAIVGSNPSYNTDCWLDCPVEAVSWHDAAAFANALSASEGLTSCYTCSGTGDEVSCDRALSPYDCDGYRLPTEAEWEAAARCGEALLYAGSNDLGAVGWYVNNSGGRVQPVADKAPNACGLYDMSGNVWEWTQDRQMPYTSEGRTDPEGSEDGGNRMHRGGSWGSGAERARVPHRDGNSSGFKAYDLGFRLARTVL